MKPNKVLKEARVKRFLSQQDVADKVGTTPLTVSRWERGITVPSLHFQGKLCELFGIAQGVLFPPVEAQSQLGDSTEHDEDDGRRDQTVPLLKEKEEIFFYKSKMPDACEFFGRARERGRALRRVKAGLPTSIVGPRRIGKTWLLDYLRITALAELGDKVIIGSVLAGCATLSEFLAMALKELEIPGPIDKEGRSYLQALESGVRGMLNKGVIPVLCIDKFERFCRIPELSSDILDKLRAIMQLGLCLVTTSRQPLNKVIRDVFGETNLSPFDNIFMQFTLSPFMRAEAEEFMQKKGAKADFTTEECDKLLRYAQQKGVEQWYPEKLQRAGMLLYDDKVLAPDLYRPQDPAYWQEFEQRVEEGFREE